MLTVSFHATHCSDNPTDSLQGCVHVRRCGTAQPFSPQACEPQYWPHSISVHCSVRAAESPSGPGPVQAKRCHPQLRLVTARQLVHSGGRHFGGRLRPRINRLNGSTSCHSPFSIRGLRPDVPHRRRQVRSFKSSWPVPHLPTAGTDLGKHRRESIRHSPRCTRALMRALGRSRWLNGLCRSLHRGCTDGTGPRPSVEP